MSAVFAHGHLRLYLLSLLAERPMHGYELIQELSERFGGTYTPSAGTIYPRLSKLEQDGLVSKASDGRKSVYSITESGRTEIVSRQGELDGIESELSDSVRRLADQVRSSVEGAMRTLRADLAAAARDLREEGTASARSRRTAAADRPTPTRGRALLHEAEAALTDFRAAVQVELGRASANGRLDPDAVRTLRDGLERLRAEVVEALRAPD